MTAITFGAALLGNEAPAANVQPSLPQLLLSPQPATPQIPGLPMPALPVMPIRFGDQLRQSLDVEPLPTLPVTPRLPGEPTLDELLSKQPSSSSSDEEQPADDALPVFPSLITFSQPIALPLEYAQRSQNAGQPQQLPDALLPVAPATQSGQSAAPRDNTLVSVLAAIPETSALGAMTINPATLSLAAKHTLAALVQDNQSSAPVLQLASLTNAGLAQALVDGMTQQPGVLAPVAPPPAQPLNMQRSALESALGDRLQMQITQRSEHAVIRLDPPSMGTIEIVIQREAGNIQVHLRASNSEVARQLHGIGDSLRQDLVQRQQGDVSVHVSDGSREQSASQHSQRQSHSQREAPGRALAESNEESSKSFTLAVDEERGA
jgi:flagellar hook-length control protein FliK